MKLSTKLFTLLAVLLTGIVAIGMFSLNRMDQINEKSTEISANWLPSTVAVQSLNTLTSESMRSAIFTMKTQPYCANTIKEWKVSANS